jgi:hypothetical protein
MEKINVSGNGSVSVRRRMGRYLLKINTALFRKILGFLGRDYEECSLLGCDTVWLF